MSLCRSGPFTALLLTLAGPSLVAQSVESRSGAASAPRTAPSVARALGGAVLGGAAGVLVGGLTGGWIGANHCAYEGNPDSCYGIYGVLAGSAIGFTLGTPVGAHLLNRRRGSLPWGLGASVAVALAGAVALNQVDKQVHGDNRSAAFNTVLITVPLLQIGAATIIEARSSRR